MTMTVFIWVIPLLLFSFYVQGFDSNKFDVIFFVQGIVLLYLISFFLIFFFYLFLSTYKTGLYLIVLIGKETVGEDAV